MAGRGSVAVVGVGHTRYGKLPEYDAYELGLWALKEALTDSGLRFEDVDGLIINRIPDYQRFCEIAGLNPSSARASPRLSRSSTATTAARAETAMAARATPTAAAMAGNGSPMA